MSIRNLGPFRRKGVDSYVKRMSKPREKSVYDSTATAILQKAGIDVPEDPASIYQPEQLWEQLKRYGKRTVFEEDEHIDKAIKVAFKVFGYRSKMHSKLTTLSTESELLNAVKMEKSAGVYFLSKGEAWPRAFTRSQDIIDGSKRPNPCLAGVRTQRGNKTRLVWGYPLDVTILEARFAKPLIDVYKQIRTPMPYALRRHEIGARLEYSFDRRLKVALDFSKFDSSVPQELIRVAFRIMKTWFTNLTSEDEIAWETVINYFIHTPIVMIDGNLYAGKEHGVPSGSYFTQLVDSIVNFIIIYAAMDKFNLQPNALKIHILGDDSVFGTNNDVCLNDLKAYFLTKGFKLNVEKSEVKRHDETIHFIGFDWWKGTPNRSFDKAILSISQPEKWRKREFSYIEENRRALRLITEMTMLGMNLYGLFKIVCGNAKPREHLYFSPEGKGLTDFQKYVLEEHGSISWRNSATGIWI